MENTEIIFAGDSHYGKYALQSLQKEFPSVYILDNGREDILNLKRSGDIIINTFNDTSCPFVFLGGYAPFINQEQLSKKKYINVHGALLPKYRGMHPTFWAIMNGEKTLGITYHIVNEFMDAGPILAQYSFAFTGQTVAAINEQIGNLIKLHTGTVVKNFINGKIVGTIQNEEEATFGCRRNLNDCFIDFSFDTELMQRYFKALTPPYPLPRIRIKDTVYEITNAEIVNRTCFSAIGRVQNIDNRGIWIKIHKGYLIISELRTDDGRYINPRTLVTTGYRILKEVINDY